MSNNGKSVGGKANKMTIMKHLPLKGQKNSLRKFEYTFRSFPRSLKPYTRCEMVPGMARGASADLGQTLHCNFQ